MIKEKYSKLFQAFEKAPMEGFMSLLFQSMNETERELVMIEDVSYHRFNSHLVSLEAWMCMAPIENNQWIWARIEMDAEKGSVEEAFFTKDSYGQQALPTLSDCVAYYSRKM